MKGIIPDFIGAIYEELQHLLSTSKNKKRKGETEKKDENYVEKDP